MTLFSKNSPLSLLFLFTLFASCAASKKLQNTDVATLPVRAVEDVLEKLQAQHVDAEWINAKAKINFQDATQTKNYTATIRLRKDSVLWMNVKKLGVEGARVLIDKDSVYVIDRLNKEYYIKSLEYLAEEFHLPSDFGAIQTMVLGNPYLLDNSTFQVENHATNYQLSWEDRDGLLSDYWVNGQSFLLEAMSFLDLRYDRKLSVQLEDYQTTIDSSFTFSYRRIFEMLSEDTGDVKVQFNFIDVEHNVPKKMPFAISSRYRRVD